MGLRALRLKRPGMKRGVHRAAVEVGAVEDEGACGIRERGEGDRVRSGACPLSGEGDVRAVRPGPVDGEAGRVKRRSQRFTESDKRLEGLERGPDDEDARRCLGAEASERL